MVKGAYFFKMDSGFQKELLIFIDVLVAKLNHAKV